MPTAEFLQLLVVAAISGFVGYLLGRATARSGPAHTGSSVPLPGPEIDPSAPRRTSTPPPAGADTVPPSSDRAPPRRSSAPPPAAAGLMKRDD
jgi:hypothetical protein